MPADAFAIVEGAWLLRPALAERLLKKDEVGVVQPPPPPPPRPGVEERPDEGPVVVPPPSPPPAPPPATYRRVTIEAPVDWRGWYDFYQAVIKPLAEAGVEVNLSLRIEAQGEIDANLVDLSVKESVLQLDPRGKVDVEG